MSVKAGDWATYHMGRGRVKREGEVMFVDQQIVNVFRNGSSLTCDRIEHTDIIESRPPQGEKERT